MAGAFLMPEDEVPPQTGGGAFSVAAPAPQRMLAGQWDMIAKKRLAGVPLSPEEEQAVAAAEAYKMQVGEPTARQMMDATGVGGAMQAGADMMADPSLANATNLGVRSALAALKPVAAAKLLGGGLGLGAAQDAGLMPGGSAQAADDGLNDAQRARLRDLETVISRGNWRTGAERRMVESEAQGLRDIKTQFATRANAARIDAGAAQKASEQAEYDRAVQTAERLRSQIAAGNTSFKDSEVGKVYEKLGGLTPALAGFAGGAIGRMAHGGGSLARSVGLPAVEGTGAAFATMNAPLFYDSFSTPPLNPERQALETYARELPPTHPRKAEFQGYAERLPTKNPVQTDARDELFSPAGNLRRLGASALEGGIAGVTGGNMGPAARRAIEGVGEIPGAVATGFNRGMERARAAKPPPSPSAAASREEQLLAAEASRSAPPRSPETAASTSRSAPPAGGRAGPEPAAAPPSEPGVGSSRNPSSPPASMQADNTTSVSPRQFVAGVRPEPASGRRLGELKSDPEMVKAALETALRNNGRLNGTTFHAALTDKGVDISYAQAARLAQRLRSDEKFAEQMALLREKTTRQIGYRGAKAALKDPE